ncbi:hypothetical protein [uncultured Halopseudomonas sp.]|uniref:hypothetical protein n=1 Tax=uncultured Halopseudomonas sp. TaxID=2901193 RepID=UPI0030ECFAE1
MATSDQIGQPMHIVSVMPVQEPLHIKPRTTGLPYDDYTQPSTSQGHQKGRERLNRKQDVHAAKEGLRHEQ